MKSRWAVRGRFFAITVASAGFVVFALAGVIVPQDSNPRNDAELWLSWSLDAREKYVWGYLEGFQDGKRAGCTYYADKITSSLSHEPLPPEKLPRSACFNETPTFPQQSKTYVDAVTAYFTKYPNDRKVGMQLILRRLASPPSLTIDEIHAELTR